MTRSAMDDPPSINDSEASACCCVDTIQRCSDAMLSGSDMDSFHFIMQFCSGMETIISIIAAMSAQMENPRLIDSQSAGSRDDSIAVATAGRINTSMS